LVLVVLGVLLVRATLVLRLLLAREEAKPQADPEQTDRAPREPVPLELHPAEPEHRGHAEEPDLPLQMPARAARAAHEEEHAQGPPALGDRAAERARNARTPSLHSSDARASTFACTARSRPSSKGRPSSS